MLQRALGNRSLDLPRDPSGYCCDGGSSGRDLFAWEEM